MNLMVLVSCRKIECHCLLGYRTGSKISKVETKVETVSPVLCSCSKQRDFSSIKLAELQALELRVALQISHRYPRPSLADR